MEAIQLTNIAKPGENDVIVGRGGGSNHHPGNKHFRKLVEESKAEYRKLDKKFKAAIADRIVRQCRAQVPPGRFLKYDAATNVWNDIGDDSATGKAMQCLREQPKAKKDKKTADVPLLELKQPVDVAPVPVVKAPTPSTLAVLVSKPTATSAVAAAKPLWTRQDVEVEIKLAIKSVAGRVSSGQLDQSARLMDVGLDADAIDKLTAELHDRFDIEVTSTIRYDSISALVNHIYATLSEMSLKDCNPSTEATATLVAKATPKKRTPAKKAGSVAKMLDSAESGSVKWSVEDDTKLTKLVEGYGTTKPKWGQVANDMEDRSAKQCRERWLNQLRPGIKKGNWTKEEDAMIRTLQKQWGSRWSKIASCLVGRTDNDIKNRW
jgi:hypothetical protein